MPWSGTHDAGPWTWEEYLGMLRAQPAPGVRVRILWYIGGGRSDNYFAEVEIEEGSAAMQSTVDEPLRHLLATVGVMNLRKEQ